MRIAFFSPMPPARSGIADYSAALAEELSRLAAVEIFPAAPAAFDPSRFDVCLYQMGNNPHHVFVYEAAMAHPGVVVVHEANLHHLMTELTIRRGDWDTYLRECEYEGGAAALAFARRVKALEVGPDYAGIPMVRRLLERSRGAIVHSTCVATALAAAGFRRPVARIPHGAWLDEGDRLAYRLRLGLDETTPLAGVFGFLKPYKRIAESLRAFRRVVRVEPRARLILAGEPHPDFPVEQLISTLGLRGHVRVLGFTAIEDFAGYMSACDVILNLRYPTVGESSGSLLRALGLGRPALVSDVGSFRDFPDDVCLKVPVGDGEEDLIFEYLNLVFSRPEVAASLGRNAREYVARECNWAKVARQYLEFLEAVVANRAWSPSGSPAAPVAVVPVPEAPVRAAAVVQPAAQPAAESAPPMEPPREDDLLRWAPPDPLYRDYLDTHLTRLLKTLEMTPPGGPGDRILEMGSYLQITPALRERLGYGEVRGCYFGEAGTVEHRSATSIDGAAFEIDLELFDAEKDRFPYEDGYFSTVLCCELIEHLFGDPMHLMFEVNRILQPGGHLLLTTPNIASLRALSAILQGYHPGFFQQYIRPNAKGEVDPRHNREYAPREIHQLFSDSGFEVVSLETGPFREKPRPELIWVHRLLDRYKLPSDQRGDGIYALGRKTGAPRRRYPEWLYAG